MSTIYSEVRISKPLSANVFRALRPSSVDLSSGTLTGSNYGVASQTVALFDLGEDVRTVAVAREYGDISRTSTKSKARARHQGKETATVTMEVYLNYETDESNDLLVSDTSGHRLLYVERDDASVLVAVVDISRVSEPAVDESGDMVVTVDLTNAGNQVLKWT